jgi:hypothetical protein
MRFPDWKDYENGALSAAEMEQARRLLAESDEARRDYEAYQAYRMALREAGRQDEASFDRLQALLARSMPRRRPPIRWAPFGALGAAALAAAYFAGPSLFGTTSEAPPSTARLDQTVARLETSDPLQASRWASKGVSFPVYPYRLDGEAKLTGASYGRDWAAYEYATQTCRVKLVIRPRGYMIPNAQERRVGKTVFYVGRTIVWNCPACAYELIGGTEETRWRVAQAAAKELFGSL